MRSVIEGLLLVLFFFLPGCKEQERENIIIDGSSSSIDTTFHDINSFGRVRFGDTSKFIKLKCGLYVNSEGVIAYQAVDNSYRMIDTTGNRKAHYIYLTTVWGVEKSNTINDGQEMRYVVDTATFQLLGLYGIDKNHVYDINPMLDGGTIAINEYADVNTFRLAGNGLFAKDKKHCYYCGRVIKGADIESFHVLDTSYSHFIAFDKSYFYDGEEKMSLEDVREQKLDSIRKRKRKL